MTCVSPSSYDNELKVNYVTVCVHRRREGGKENEWQSRDKGRKRVIEGKEADISRRANESQARGMVEDDGDAESSALHDDCTYDTRQVSLSLSRLNVDSTE